MSLTVVIPVYNSEAYIHQGFESIIAIGKDDLDKYDIRVIFVNDGSADGSAEVLAAIADEYSFVTVINQPNLGSSVARNRGIEAVETHWFIFMDSDDWIDMPVLLELLEIADREKTDLLSYRMESYDLEYNKIGEMAAHPVPHDRVLTGREALIAGYQPSSICLFIYRTAFIKENNLFFVPKITQQDVELSVRLMLNAQRIWFSEMLIYSYFKHGNSVTKPKDPARLQKYLRDSIQVAFLIKQNTVGITDEKLKFAIEKNANSVVWNLLWRFCKQKDEVDYAFKMECIADLRASSLYPIKGELKTNFQRITRMLMNKPLILRYLLQ